MVETKWTVDVSNRVLDEECNGGHDGGGDSARFVSRLTHAQYARM